MCKCEGVEIGSYGNQVELNAPEHMPREGCYCIDSCIANEIQNLWFRGITTTGCCCGHNEQSGYIGVSSSDIPIMKMLGYEVRPNKLYPEAEDSFYPESVFRVGVENEWVKPVMQDYQMRCCDCGLIHEVDFKVVRVIDREYVEDVEDQSLQVVFRVRRNDL